MHPYFNNVLPPQQILQVNGKASIEALRLSPNSSVLVADQTQPVIWKCVSDSMGNVTASAFDISPHKDEAEVEKENLTNTLLLISERLERLEKNYESITNRSAFASNGTVKTNDKPNARVEKPTGNVTADGPKQPAVETSHFASPK